ncbi:MAG: ABC transporter permease, partial [bacterium]
MSFGRIKALVIRHLYLYQRSLPRLMDVFFWPTMDLLVWGFLSVYLEKLSLGNVNIISVLLGAVIFWGMLQQSQGSVSTTFLEDVWEKNFLNLFVTPLSISEFLVATVCLVMIRVVLGLVVISLLAIIFYQFNIFVLGLAVIPFLFNLILFGCTLGFLITVVIFRYGTSAQVLAFGFIFLIQPFSAVFYPLSALPQSVQFVAYFLPSTYVFEGMRQLINQGTFNGTYALYSLAINIVYLALVIVLFYAVFGWVKKKG